MGEWQIAYLCAKFTRKLDCLWVSHCVIDNGFGCLLYMYLWVLPTLLYFWGSTLMGNVMSSIWTSCGDVGTWCYFFFFSGSTHIVVFLGIYPNGKCNVQYLDFLWRCRYLVLFFFLPCFCKFS